MKSTLFLFIRWPRCVQVCMMGLCHYFNSHLQSCQLVNFGESLRNSTAVLVVNNSFKKWATLFNCSAWKWLGQVISPGACRRWKLNNQQSNPNAARVLEVQG